MDRAEEAALMRYMQSPKFRRRAAKLQAELKARMDRGETWTFDEVATRLRLPLDVVVGGFEHSMAKAGMPVRAAGRVQ